MKKRHTKTTNLKMSEPASMKSLNCLVHFVPFPTLRNILNTSSRRIKYWLINLLLKYISTEFRKELYLELDMGFILSSWHSRLRNDLAILRKKIKVTNGKNLSCLENIEQLLVHVNIVNTQHQCDSWVLSTFAPNKSFCQPLNASTTNDIEPMFTQKHFVQII